MSLPLAKKMAQSGSLAQSLPRLGLLARRPVWLAALVLVFVLAATVVVGAFDTVTVQADGVEKQVTVFGGDVAKALERAGVTITEADLVSPGLDERLEDGMTVAVRRAVKVKVVADGKETEVSTAVATVADLIKVLGIELGPLDRTVPTLDQGLTADSTIAVIRGSEKVTTRKVNVGFRTQRKDDPTMPLGLEKVVQSGKAGVKEQTVRILYEDGKPVKTVIVSERMIAEPVAKVVYVGTTGEIVRGDKTITFVKAFRMEATGYTAGPESTGKYADGYTYTGMKAQRGVVAVDPRVIPLGSKLYVDGYGYAIAADIGGAIKGQKIDLCFDTVKEALDWGRRPTNVYVISFPD